MELIRLIFELCGDSQTFWNRLPQCRLCGEVGMKVTVVYSKSRVGQLSL